jgi:hypothetical protein
MEYTMSIRKDKGDTIISSSWITKERRLGLLMRDNFTCQYCGRDMKNMDPNLVTLDHLVPRNPLVAHGGGNNTNENLVSACKSCNSSRKDREWKEFAPGGSVERIEIQRFLPVNLALARAIISNKISSMVADVENLR